MVTRPLQEALSTAQDIEKIGFNSIINPLSEIKIQNLSSKDLTAFNNKSKILIVTSVNSLKAINKLKISKKFSVILVGESNLQKAIEYGYNNIIFCGKNVDEVLNYIIKNYSRKLDEFLYLSGDIITKNIETILDDNGIKAKRLVLYRAIFKEEFTQESINFIKEGKIYGVVLFSSETAKIFQKLAAQYSLESFSKCKMFCLSEKIKNHINLFPEKNIYIAENPSYQYMIKLVLSSKLNKLD